MYYWANNILHILVVWKCILYFQATKLTRSDRFSTALLRIFVTAAPENPPIFSRDVYEASIVENTPQDIFVVNVHATDNDVVSTASTPVRLHVPPDLL